MQILGPGPSGSESPGLEPGPGVGIPNTGGGAGFCEPSEALLQGDLGLDSKPSGAVDCALSLSLTSPNCRIIAPPTSSGKQED